MTMNFLIIGIVQRVNKTIWLGKKAATQEWKDEGM